MSEGALLSARCRIRIFPPEPVFGYFLQEQKVTRPWGDPPTLCFFRERKEVAGLRPADLKGLHPLL